MDQIQNSKRYDLEERTFQFAKNEALYVKLLPKTLANNEFVETNDNGFTQEGMRHFGEAGELKKILSSIHENSK
jgi:hypothetical protein